jgi:hypothetical protein
MASDSSCAARMDIGASGAVDEGSLRERIVSVASCTPQCCIKRNCATPARRRALTSDSDDGASILKLQLMGTLTLHPSCTTRYATPLCARLARGRAIRWSILLIHLRELAPSTTKWGLRFCRAQHASQAKPQRKRSPHPDRLRGGDHRHG